MSIFSFFYGTFLRQGVEQHHGLLASLAAYMCPGALCTRMPIFIFFLFWSVMRWQRVPSVKRLSVFLLFMALWRGWTSQKESFSLSSSGLQKKNHIFSYCHCCCHMKFSNLTISVLCDVFTYFITFRWSCCFSLGACLRVPVASKHTYRLEKWPWTLPKKKMSRRWWPSLRNRQRCGFTARLNSFSVPIIGIRFHCSLEFF